MFYYLPFGLTVHTTSPPLPTVPTYTAAHTAFCARLYLLLPPPHTSPRLPHVKQFVAALLLHFATRLPHSYHPFHASASTRFHAYRCWFACGLPARTTHCRITYYHPRLHHPRFTVLQHPRTPAYHCWVVHRAVLFWFYPLHRPTTLAARLVASRTSLLHHTTCLPSCLILQHPPHATALRAHYYAADARRCRWFSCYYCPHARTSLSRCRAAAAARLRCAAHCALQHCLPARDSFTTCRLGRCLPLLPGLLPARTGSWFASCRRWLYYELLACRLPAAYLAHHSSTCPALGFTGSLDAPLTWTLHWLLPPQHTPTYRHHSGLDSTATSLPLHTTAYPCAPPTATGFTACPLAHASRTTPARCACALLWVCFSPRSSSWFTTRFHFLLRHDCRHRAPTLYACRVLPRALHSCVTDYTTPHATHLPHHTASLPHHCCGLRTPLSCRATPAPPTRAHHQFSHCYTHTLPFSRRGCLPLRSHTHYLLDVFTVPRRAYASRTTAHLPPAATHAHTLHVRCTTVTHTCPHTCLYTAYARPVATGCYAYQLPRVLRAANTPTLRILPGSRGGLPPTGPPRPHRTSTLPPPRRYLLLHAATPRVALVVTPTVCPHWHTHAPHTRYPHLRTPLPPPLRTGWLLRVRTHTTVTLRTDPTPLTPTFTHCRHTVVATG